MFLFGRADGKALTSTPHQTRVGEQCTPFMVVLNRILWDGAWQNIEGVQRDFWMCRMQCAQVLLQGAYICLRDMCFPCCNETTGEQLVDGQDDGIGFSRMCCEPCAYGSSITGLRIVIHILRGRRMNLSPDDFAAVYDKIFAWRTGVQWDQENRRCFLFCSRRERRLLISRLGMRVQDILKDQRGNDEK